MPWLLERCGKECNRYDRAYFRCKDAKINPEGLERTREMISFAGRAFVCNRSKWKTQILITRLYNGR